MRCQAQFQKRALIKSLSFNHKTEFKIMAMNKPLLILLLLIVLKVHAQVPQQINYQGVARNSVGSVIANQNINLRLSIREGTATGNVVYRESRLLKTNSFGLFVTAIGAPGANSVAGSFGAINWGTGVKFLQIEMDPAGSSNYIDMGTSQLLSVPYSIYAGTAGSASPVGNAGGDLTGEYPTPLIKDGVITNSKIKDGEISASKLEAGLIPTSLPPNGSAGGDLMGTYPNPTIKSGIINNSKLADNAVGTSKLQNGSVTSIKLAPGLIPTSLPPMGDAGGDLSGTYPNPTLAPGVITGNKIAFQTITADKLAPGVIPSSIPISGTAGGDLSGNYPNPAIALGAVDNSKLADNAVSTLKVQDGAITLSKLSAGIIPTSLPPNGFAGGDLTGNYPNPLIANNTIDANKLADNSVIASKIVDGSVTTTKLAAGVIPTTLPPSGAAGGDLTGNYPNPVIANNAINSQKIADGSVTNTKIGDNEISTSKIQDGAITASKLDPALLIVGGGGSPTGAAGGDLSGTYPNPLVANNAITTSKIADASVTIAKLANGIIPTSLPPNGSAGGDLSGTYPNPSVNKIQGIAVGTTAPASGQVLKFNGTSWVPSDDNIASFGAQAGGDLSGTYPNPNIASGAVTGSKIANGAVNTPKIQDGAVTYSKLSTASATVGQVLKFDGTNWAPGTDNLGGSPSGAAGGDLTGTYPNPTINANAITSTKLADNSVSTSKIVDGSITSIKLASGVIPTTLPPSGAAGGDLNGNYPNPAVNKIQGIGISNTVPVNGQVLTFNGTQWIASTPSSGLSLPFSSVVSSASNLFSLTNSGSGSGLEGINSSTSSNVSGVIGKITAASSGAMSAGVAGINYATGTNGIGVYGSHAGNGHGVHGFSVTGTGVYGESPSGFGLMGISTTGAAIYGQSIAGNAGSFYVSDASNSNDAVFISNFGDGNALKAESEKSNGIVASTNSSWSAAVQAFNNAGGTGIWGITLGGTGSGVKATNTTDGGTALEGELLGVSTGNIAVFKVDGANMARINEAGKGFFNGGTQTGGADVAETFDVEGSRSNYEPGDVLIISQSSDRTVEKSQSSYSTLVAGVYATKPGVLLTEKNASEDHLDEMVPMGVIGVIPTKVCNEGGAIKRGDLLVTSSITGVAMKADPDKVKVGQVIGKALEDYNSNGVGKIKVLVSIK